MTWATVRKTPGRACWTGGFTNSAPSIYQYCVEFLKSGSRLCVETLDPFSRAHTYDAQSVNLFRRLMRRLFKSDIRILPRDTSDSNASIDAVFGTRGRFAVGAKCGSGKFGAVFLAVDALTDTRVALKCARRVPEPEMSKARATLVAEAAALAVATAASLLAKAAATETQRERERERERVVWCHVARVSRCGSICLSVCLSLSHTLCAGRAGHGRASERGVVGGGVRRWVARSRVNFEKPNLKIPF